MSLSPILSADVYALCARICSLRTYTLSADVYALSCGESVYVRRELMRTYMLMRTLIKMKAEQNDY